MAEPFAGGAGASLTLLYLEEVKAIYINDADRAVHDFWWTLINRARPFLDLVSQTLVTVDEWRCQQAVYRAAKRISRLRRAFSAFFLNRCNRSGIIVNGGPIGGLKQAGKWKLDARFNRPALRRRCEKVAEYRERIYVSCNDGIQFIDGLDPESTFFFVDPPYFEKGPELYLNALSKDYHATLAARLRGRQNGAWVLTYDDCAEVRRMYRGWAAIRPYCLRYSACVRRPGRELLITPKWMKLPARQPSLAVSW